MKYYVNSVKVSKEMFYTMLNYQFVDMDKAEKERLRRELHRNKILCIDGNVFEKV